MAPKNDFDNGTFGCATTCASAFANGVAHRAGAFFLSGGPRCGIWGARPTEHAAAITLPPSSRYVTYPAALHGEIPKFVAKSDAYAIAAVFACLPRSLLVAGPLR
jgi:hypothetical protein